MANPGDFAYTVKQQADIVRIIGDYVKLKKAGAQNFSGLCPFHSEKTPSFSVNTTRQFYHCFGCRASGDVLGFVQKIENITFPEAVRLVAQKARHTAAQADVRDRRRSARGQAPRCAGGPERARLRVLRGAVAASRGRSGARISCGARAHGRSDQDIPHRLRAGFGLHLARPLEGRGRRRDVEGVRTVLVEAARGRRS